MTVNRTQNSGIPAPAQAKVTDVTDGTSNTMASSQKKTENPFSKDSFEIVGFPTLDGSNKDAAFRIEQKVGVDNTAATGVVAEGNLYVGFQDEVSRKSSELQSNTPRGEATTLKAQDAVDIKSKTPPAGGESVVENLNVKYTFMDYTDDDCS